MILLKKTNYRVLMAELRAGARSYVEDNTVVWFKGDWMSSSNEAGEKGALAYCSLEYKQKSIWRLSSTETRTTIWSNCSTPEWMSETMQVCTTGKCLYMCAFAALFQGQSYGISTGTHQEMSRQRKGGEYTQLNWVIRKNESITFAGKRGRTAHHSVKWNKPDYD